MTENDKHNSFATVVTGTEMENNHDIVASPPSSLTCWMPGQLSRRGLPETGVSSIINWSGQTQYQNTPFLPCINKQLLFKQSINQSINQFIRHNQIHKDKNYDNI